jgi:hypothetical protein
MRPISTGWALIGLGALLASLACGTERTPPAESYSSLHTSWRRVRVLVADGEAGRLSVIDAEDEEVIARLELPAPVRLASTHTGNFGLLLGPSGLGFLASGVAIVDHVDHIHVYKSQPRVHPFTLGAAPPRSVVSSHGWVVVSLPGSGPGAALALEEQSLLGPDPQPRTVTWPMTGAQPFVALPGQALLLDAGMLRVRSFPGPGTEAGTDRDLWPCQDAGEPAITPGRVALPCGEGLAVIDVPGGSGGALVSALVPYPDGKRPRSARIHPGNDAVVGDAGDRAMLVATRDARATWSAGALPLVLPAEACAYGVEQRDGSRIVVLGADGVLRDFALDGTGARSSARLVPPFACDATVRPQLALAPERAYISDPASGVVHDVDLRTMRRVRGYPVGGKPGPMAVLGLDLKNANVAPGAEHPDDAGVSETAGVIDAAAD